MQNETKGPQNCPLNSFWVHKLLLGIGSALPGRWYTQCFDISSDTPLEKTDLPFACRYQLQVASWSGVEAHVHFPVPGRDLHCTCTGLMCTTSICEFICAEVMWCLEDTISLVSSSSGSYNLSDSVYTHRSLSLIGRRKISCLGLTECSSISGSLHTVHTWVSVLVPI